jgi:UDP-N-acetylglucosamine transferase subunit ALG13/glycosyltransferase involved in cell wall biosynthesis
VSANPRISHALVTAARDEAENLAALAETVVAQTLRPAAWIIVDDGSRDGTAAIAGDLAERFSWIRLVQTGRDREGLREGRREGRDLLTLEQGLRELREPVDLITKLDADITLPADYFERLAAEFASDPRLGMATGTRCELEGGRWRERHLTAAAVAAQCRTYRWECWQQVQPLEPCLGWDGVDEARAVLAGWRTKVVPGLLFRHHRPMGQRDGSPWRARSAEGIAAYYMGYRPSYLLARVLWHARRDVSALGMIWGWSTAAARRESRRADPAVRAYFRRQQLARHLLRRLREVRRGATGETQVEVLVVTSAGGHLHDACVISSAWASRTRAWVSFDKPDVRSRLAGERVYFGHGPTNRSLPNLIRNLGLAWRVVGETRPRVLVTTGAGIAVPFAWVARLRGARIVYVECAGRIDRPSLSARLIAPVAGDIYAQWPELAASWRRAEYRGNVLFSQATTAPATPGTGVVVTVGTTDAPFDRLVRAAGRLEDERVVVQHGVSTVRLPGAECVDFLPFEAFDAVVGSARVVVTHAGIGSVAAALAHGRRPVVVPRLRRFHEHVDDHQLFFARRLDQAGLATVVEDLEQLPEVVASRDHLAPPLGGPDLTAELGQALDSLLEARAGLDQRSGVPAQPG